MESEKSLTNLNIKKLKALCQNLGIVAKSKWKKRDYIESILKHQTSNTSVTNENRLSLGNRELAETGIANANFDSGANLTSPICANCKFSFELCGCKSFLTSTPIGPRKKKSIQRELVLNCGVNKFFQEKCGENAPQPDQITIQWTKNPHPSEIPSISSVDVFNYLVQRKSELDNCSNKNFKGFNRAVAHFVADDIVTGIESVVVNGQFIYVKSRCYPSQRADSYRVVVVLDALDGNICGGGCECVVGKSGGCSHVGALLLYLEKYSTMDDADFEVACTSKPCAWVAPKTRKYEAKPLSEISFNKPRLATQNTLNESEELPSVEQNISYHEFDPRHPDDRNPEDRERPKLAIMALATIYPKTGGTHFWEFGDVNDAEVLSCFTVPNEVSAHVYNTRLVYREIDELTKHEFVKKQTVSREVIEFIEKATASQSSSQLWKDLRRGRLTSSIFGAILACQEKRFPTSLVDNILNPSKLDRYATLPQAILRGRNLEEPARKCYEKTFKVLVAASGLSLMEEYSFIGASGDGIISDDSEVTKGVLEIKCPSAVKGKDITKMPVLNIVEAFPSFFLKSINGEVKLDRKSHYYSQVQGEMAVKNLSWADFVVYTEAPEGGLFRERIIYDKQFWENKLLPKLVHFFTKYIVPFLIELDDE